MSKEIKSKNSKLFQEAKVLRESIKSELHCKARNLANTIEPLITNRDKDDRNSRNIVNALESLPDTETKGDIESIFENWFEGYIPEYDENQYTGSLYDIAKVAFIAGSRESDPKPVNSEIGKELEIISNKLMTPGINSFQIGLLASRIKNLSKEQSESEWISVCDRLPEKEGYYLVHTPLHNWGTDTYPCYEGMIWMDQDGVFRCGNTSVKKWRPMPEPPKESES